MCTMTPGFTACLRIPHLGMVEEISWEKKIINELQAQNTHSIFMFSLVTRPHFQCFRSIIMLLTHRAAYSLVLQLLATSEAKA